MIVFEAKVKQKKKRVYKACMTISLMIMEMLNIHCVSMIDDKGNSNDSTLYSVVMCICDGCVINDKHFYCA